MKQSLHQKCKNLTVLFIEDYIPFQKKIASVLNDYFDCIQIASNGKEGFEKYQDFYQENEKFYDIVITDYNMPEFNGIELIKKIKQFKNEQIFIVISAHQDSEYLIEYINLGIVHFIPKPVGPEKLLQVLNKVSDIIIQNGHLFYINNSLVWNKNKKSLFLNNELLFLARYDILLMEILVEDFNTICTIEKILNHFYLHNEDIKQDNIRNMVVRLRKKISSISIENIYGIGYKLVSS